MTEEKIIELYFRRNPDAIYETELKYGNYCYCVAYNILSNNEDSEESVNDTFLETWKAMYRNAGFVRADDLDGEEIRVVIYDSPQLAKADLILGWPEGTAQLVCEDTWMEYQRLEVIVDRQWDSGRHDVNKHMFLFHPTEQYLLSFSARDESFSFEDLRQVAERLEPISLDFEYELRRDNVNFSIADHGSG